MNDDDAIGRGARHEGSMSRFRPTRSSVWAPS